MSDQGHIRTDLTRWNRAGLTKFDFVDGDASVWLEELRLAMMGLYMRNADANERTPDTWRDLWLDETDPDRRLALDIPDLASKVVWEKLAPKVPKTTESRGRRSERLLDQYDGDASADQAWEIMRAYSRAAHVLLGHMNAYANEGYLRTATQWDNLRRLAALVNYQPTPPASASTLIALSVKEDVGAVEISKGLAMKYAPNDGGAPLIFETSEALATHPKLNAARLMNWDVNARQISVSNKNIRWIYPENTEVTPGGIVVMTDGTNGVAGTVSKVTADTENERARIEVDATREVSIAKGQAQLLTEAEDVRSGLARKGEDEYELKVKGGAGIQKGDLMRLTARDVDEVVTIRSVKSGNIKVQTETAVTGKVILFPMSKLAKAEDGVFRTGSDGATKMYYRHPRGMVRMLDASDGDQKDAKAIKRNDKILGYEYGPKETKDDFGYIDAPDTDGVSAEIVATRKILQEDDKAGRSVSFEGKPPKALAEGAWVVARSNDGTKLMALKVEEVHTAVGQYDVLFNRRVRGAPETLEFHGPMKSPLRPEGYDRSPEKAVPGSARTVLLQDIPEAARAILRPGRTFMFCDEFGDGSSDVQATITDFEHKGGNRLQLTFDPSESVSHLIAGNTLVRLNTVIITHGESKGPKTLGSGDGERVDQAFTLQVRDISHIPSTLSTSGVVPDLTVTVDGQAWSYRDYTDASAEGAKVWSSTLGEDGFLRIHFRRRLPTGTSNISLNQHRVGTGSRGNSVPSLSIKKPIRKHPYVETVHQPFQTSGGADREAVSSLRRSAPSRLAANGRAVSLIDFERLAEGHASVWRARAEERVSSSSMRDIDITIVPADGSTLNQTLKDSLGALIEAYSIPGVRLSFQSFGQVHLTLGALIRADLNSYDKTDIQSAASDILKEVFSLENRDFGQPVYVAEILAALETVPGITTAQIKTFDHKPARLPNGPEAPRRVAKRDGAVAAIYPEDDQVAYLSATGNGPDIEVKGDDNV